MINLTVNLILCTFEETTVSCMCINACGCHATSQKTSTQSPFSTLSLDNAFTVNNKIH